MGRRQMETLKIKLSWYAFSEIMDKFPERVMGDMNAGLFLFTDSSVTLHGTAPPIDSEQADL